MGKLQLWGGPECTVNRAGGSYNDQCVLSGHHDRADDIDLFADLGFDAVRYPVIWERVAPNHPQQLDWRWSDDRLNRLRARGIRPIVGLVHHGSGPRYTDLLDGGFPSGLGHYAAQVAERYPWVEDWTPINEPVTTARFSALYGHWHPHAMDETLFWRALLNQVEGTQAAMRAIRQVNAAARLIQTDDLGRTYSTLRMAEQAAFDNLRRWAGWDLLFGRVTQHHPLWDHLGRIGLGDRLRRIADDPCPPDVVGINHYLTSDRFLDHRLQLYPKRTHGGNGRTRYADTEAVRVLDPPSAGLAGALREAWQRYGAPLAITEVHNGCTREEQLRWAAEAWDTGVLLNNEGIDIRAVTAWSLFGSQGWNTLLTARGAYEPGAFDVAAGKPRPTALAALWKGLPAGAPRHAVSAEQGWWRRPDRLLHRPLVRPMGAMRTASPAARAKLLICGKSGHLGRAFGRACDARGIHHILVGRDTVDLNRPEGIGPALDRIGPCWAVINAAGWTDIDAAEAAEDACYQVNAVGPLVLARACAERNIGYLGLSSDQVFDGDATQPYVESDLPRPRGAYGRSKAAMEQGCATLTGALVIRTGPLFSTEDPHNFASVAVDAMAAGARFKAPSDEVVTPTFVPTMVEAALDLLIDGTAGLWHLSDGEAVSWAEFARRIAIAMGLDPDCVDAVPRATIMPPAARPLYAALASERGIPSGSLHENLALFARAYFSKQLDAKAA